jgi:hypothetical protein
MYFLVVVVVRRLCIVLELDTVRCWCGSNSSCSLLCSGCDKNDTMCPFTTIFVVVLILLYL